MRQNLRLGTVAGVPVGAHWSAGGSLVITAALLGTIVLPATGRHQPADAVWLTAALAAAVFSASLLAHEAAHAVTAARHGVGVRSITLWLLGGVTEMDREPPDPRADLRIAVAGPVANLAAGGALYVLAAAGAAAGAAPIAVTAGTWLALMNGLLAVVNLLPGAPLDGGRVLRAALWRRAGDRSRAALAAARAGRLVGIAMIAGGAAEALMAGAVIGGLGLVFAGWFLESAARAEAAATAHGRADAQAAALGAASRPRARSGSAPA